MGRRSKAQLTARQSLLFSSFSNPYPCREQLLILSDLHSFSDLFYCNYLFFKRLLHRRQTIVISKAIISFPFSPQKYTEKSILFCSYRATAFHIVPNKKKPYHAKTAENKRFPADKYLKKSTYLLIIAQNMQISSG